MIEQRLWTQERLGTPSSAGTLILLLQVQSYKTRERAYTLKSATVTIIHKRKIHKRNPSRWQRTGYSEQSSNHFLLPNTDTEPPSMFEFRVPFLEKIAVIWPSLSQGVGRQRTWAERCSTHSRAGTQQAWWASSTPLLSQLALSPWLNQPCTQKCFRETQGSTAGALFRLLINAGIKEFLYSIESSKNRFLKLI